MLPNHESQVIECLRWFDTAGFVLPSFVLAANLSLSLVVPRSVPRTMKVIALQMLPAEAT